MQKFAGLIIVLSALFVLSSGSALALPILTLDDGIHTAVVVNDNGANDLANTEDGMISYFGTVGAWDITMALGSSYPAIGFYGFPQMHLTGSLTSLYGTGSMTFTFEDTFTLDGSVTALTSAAGYWGTLSGVSFETYIDDTLLADFGPETGGGYFEVSTMLPNLTGTEHTIKVVGTLTADAVGLSGSIDAGVTVPEPGTVVLLGSGLLGLCGYGYRRKKKMQS